ncbi:DUF4153 domain-containing protein [Deinococcus alpinitundrae]|uniref:DUF4153 domain-containing protein n=1 Tax=Deinococcus alpinitundrae TaxID=468913 RepID=UPI00137A6761|nr:DUF4153 domain-containing protein [Deinococcus alpinitundrae]
MTEPPAPLASPLTVVPPPPAPRDALPLALTAGLALLALALTYRSDGAGLNVALIDAALSGALIWTVRYRGTRPQPAALLVLGLGLVCALGLVWRGGDLMTGLNALGALMALSLGAAFVRLPGLARLGTGEVLTALLLSGGRAVYGFPTAFFRFPWARLRGGLRQRQQGGRVLVGVLLTIPVLLVFGALLGSADERFGKLLARLLTWNLGDLPNLTLQLGCWLFFLGGFSHAALLARRAAPDLSDVERAVPKLGLIELGLPLLSLSLLFCVYLGLQASSFFGRDLEAGLTYSAAAWQGFGQLAAVAALTLALLLLSHTLLRRELRLNLAYRLIGAAVLLPLSLLIVSAYLKLSAYISAYGLSEIRVLGALFLGWVSVSLLAFAVLGWRGRLERFAYFSLISGLGLIAGLNVVNPGRLIAAVNIQRDVQDVRTAERGSRQAASFSPLLDLGADAVPLIVAHLGALTFPGGALSTASGQDLKPSRGQAEQRLREHFPPSADWRSWNWARWRAQQQVERLGY